MPKNMANHNGQKAWPLVFLTVWCCQIGPGAACSRTGESAPPSPPLNTGSVAFPEKPFELLVFRDDVRAADTSVNDFVTQAMRVCVGGDYEQFRLLWSVRDEPLSRQEYERGWQAVQQIKLRALKPIKLARENSGGTEDIEPAFALLADVSFDPTQNVGKRDPLGEVALLIVREQDEWHLTRAPPVIRAWLKELVVPRPGGVTPHPADSAVEEHPD